MRRARATLLAIISGLASPLQARAQWLFNADAGVSHLRQTGIPQSIAQTLGATIDGFGDRAWLHAAALSSIQPNSAWTGQALALGGVSGSIVNPLRWEIGGALSGFSESGAPTTTSGELNARLRFGGALGGIALGGGTGASARTGDNVTLGRGSVDAWWSAGHERLLASAIVTHAGTVTYTDAGVGWRHDANGASIGATAGLRAGTGSGGWQVADAELWIAPRLALVVAAGSVLPDVVRGTPSTQYVSLGLRLAWQPHASLPIGRRDGGGVRVVLTRTPNGLTRLALSAPREATRVELMGDFTGWEPVTLQRADDGWFVERAMPPGPHRFAIRIDGGDWIAPSNVPSVRDEDLGGTLGLITVP